MLNVLVINGGRGAASLIPSLLNKEDLLITSIVNAYDDGKSTGEIRKFFQMLGPSDIRKVQELMLPRSSKDYPKNLKLFQYRFPTDFKRSSAIREIEKFANSHDNNLLGISFISEKTKNSIRIFLKTFLKSLLAVEKLNNEEFNFSDCSLMNCIFAGAYIYFNRDFEKTTLTLGQLFKLKGIVLPTNNENKKLVALRENGEMLYSEAEIVELRSNVRIERIFLLDKPPAKSKFEKLNIEEKKYYLSTHHCNVPIASSVIDVISQSNIIVYGPGTQHSSLYPSYLSTGLSERIAEKKNALKVFITNIGADYETPSYKASDYILGAYKYLALSSKRNFSMKDFFDINLINKSNFKDDNTYVKYDEEKLNKLPIDFYLDDFEDKKSLGKHNGDKIVDTILNLYEKKFFNLK